MAIRRIDNGRRRGATLVESAFVLSVVVMFLCGVFEFGRLFMDWNLLNNATREGCRYALANNTSSTISTDVTNLVTNYMAGENTNINGFTVTVSGTHQGTSTPVNNLAAGDMITVTVSGNYQFLNIIPFVSMPTSLSISRSVTMVCEGGT